MRITAVESLILVDRFHIIRVHTDEGFSGVGTVSAMNARVTDAFVRYALAPLVVGRDPLDIERLWHDMFYKPYKLGPAGAHLNAMAGIDIALWDIAGKAAGQPIYKLLGGKFREAPQVYASSMVRGMPPKEEAERALSFKELGFPGYKIHSATRWMYDDGFDQTVETVGEIRKLVGDEFQILVDVNNAYLPHTAIRVARRLEEYGVWHFEEPLADHDRGGYARLCDSVDIPIAAGEQEYTRWQFRDLILRDHIDILQPDVIKCGGFTEFRKIAAVAQTFNRPITVHNTDPTIGTAAHVHLWVATPNCIYPQEYNIEPHRLRELPILQEPPEVKGGRVAPPEDPGLGVTLDEDVVERLTTSASRIDYSAE